MGAMKTPGFTRIVTALPASVPFVGPETLERQRGRPFRARIGANENGFGPSPRAIRAMQEAAAEAWMYGDPENHDLRAALARHLAIAPANVMVGEGIDGLLGCLVRLMVAPGDRVVTSAGGYPTFAYHVAGAGGRLLSVPYRDDREDPEALAAAAHEARARLVYLANPDNPMGTWHDAATVARLIGTLPEDCLLVLDEAYVEFAPEGTAPPIDPDDPRLIRMRTFSKAHALAGARVGYAIATAELIAGFDKLRNHFGVGRISQAGALAALADQDWLQSNIAHVARARENLTETARRNGLAPIPSAANFVAMDCGGNGAFARAVVNELDRRGVFVRMPFAAPQDRCIRVSCGPDRALELFAEALPEALAAARRQEQEPRPE